jgi:short-subunit dehydrogenase
MFALITGASRGIGYETAKYLCSRNVDVCAVSRNSEGLEKLREETSETGKGNLYPVPLDISEIIRYPGTISGVLPTGVSHIDILVNNAGYLANKAFELTEITEINKMTEVNFIAPALIIGELLPFLGRSGVSHVINISSMGGFQGSAKFSGLAYYSSLKAALACLTECLSEEYKESDIVFNCLCLGSVQTEMFSEAFPGSGARTSAKEMGEYIGDFAMNGHRLYKGKILPVAKSDP